MRRQKDARMDELIEKCDDKVYFERCQRSARSAEERVPNSTQRAERSNAKAKSKARNERRLIN